MSYGPYSAFEQYSLLLLINVTSQHKLIHCILCALMTFSNALYFIYQVHLTEEETSGGLQIIPTEKSITVPNAPVLDVLFTQFRAKVTGTVACLGM